MKSTNPSAALVKLTDIDAVKAKELQTKADSANFELLKGDELHIPSTLTEAMFLKMQIDGKEQYSIGYPCLHVRGSEKSIHFLAYSTLTRRSRTEIVSETGNYTKVAEHESQGFYGTSANSLVSKLAGKKLVVSGTRLITVPKSFDTLNGKMTASDESKDRQTPVFAISGASSISAAELKELLG